jgi:hypothetical protein
VTFGRPSSIRSANARPWRWLAIFISLAATCVLGIPATSAAPRAPSPPEAAALAPAAIATPAEKPRVRRRCSTCGHLLAIRHIEATKTTPASFEFSIRMSDGSLRTSSAADAGSWKAGDRILLIGGTL